MTHIYADVIDGALFAAHQAGALGHDIGTLSEWRDALLAKRAPPQDVADLEGMAMELWAMAQGSAPIVDRVEPMAERLREFAAAARARALEDAARACEAEYVGESLGDDALPDGDIAYNTALQHAAAAIRALK